jgi:transposase
MSLFRSLKKYISFAFTNKKTNKKNETQDFPKTLNKYEVKQLRLFSKEKRDAELKNVAINISKITVKSFAKVRNFFKSLGAAAT